jgi:hypothetical protein
MAVKNSFIVYDSWGKMIRNMPAEKAGELIQAMVAHAIDGEEVTIEDQMVLAMYSMIKDKLDEDAVSYEETCKARSEAGKKGNEVRWGKRKNESQDIAKVASAISESQSVAKIAESDTESESDTVSESDTESPKETKKKSKKEKAAPTLSVEQMQDIVLQSELGCQVQDKVRDWIEYKHQRNEPYKDMGFKSLITQISKHEREAGADAVCDLIDLCMSNEWKGIIWEKLQRSARADPGGKVDWDRV